MNKTSTLQHPKDITAINNGRGNLRSANDGGKLGFFEKKMVGLMGVVSVL